MPTNSPINPGIYSLLELFRGKLEGVRFPDIDREVLEGLAAEVTTQQARLDLLRADVAAAEQLLAAAQSVLLDRAREALAYARLYAERHPELAEQLDAIRLDARAKRGPKPHKRRAAKPSLADAGAGDTPQGATDADNASPRRTRRAVAGPAELEAVG